MRIITRHITFDLLKNKFIIAFTLFLLLVTTSLLLIDNNIHKTILSLLNVVLFLIPLMSLIFTTIYVYNSIDFIELLLTQPIARISILKSFFYSFCICFFITILIAIGIPLVLFGISTETIMLIASAMLLAFIFVAIGLGMATWIKDKAKGIGMCLLLWFYFVFLYDGLILLFLIFFNDYPIENITLLLTFLNPIDIIRINLLSVLDNVALLGFTGALFQEYFKHLGQYIYSILGIILWILIPFLLARRIFLKRDF